jgi:hypothetical protein
VSSGRLQLGGVEAFGYKFTVLGSKPVGVLVFTCTQLNHFNLDPLFPFTIVVLPSIKIGI